MANVFLKEVDSMESAKKATKNASIAAYVSAIITALIASLALFKGVSVLNGYVDGWVLLDALLIIVLGYFVSRHSRFASVCLLGYFLFSQISMRIETGNFGGIFITLLFLYFYLFGILGAFYIHKHSEEEIENFV